jgi:hypothetical protein
VSTAPARNTVTQGTMPAGIQGMRARQGTKYYSRAMRARVRGRTENGALWCPRALTCCPVDFSGCEREGWNLVPCHALTAGQLDGYKAPVCGVAGQATDSEGDAVSPYSRIPTLVPTFRDPQDRKSMLIHQLDPGGQSILERGQGGDRRAHIHADLFSPGHWGRGGLERTGLQFHGDVRGGRR